MRTLLLPLALALLTGCSATNLIATTASDTAANNATLTPEVYARSAVSQNQQQKTLDCGFAESTYWSDDYDAYRQWATRQSIEKRRES